jgi:hypothetical protein
MVIKTLEQDGGFGRCEPWYSTFAMLHSENFDHEEMHNYRVVVGSF